MQSNSYKNYGNFPSRAEDRTMPPARFQGYNCHLVITMFYIDTYIYKYIYVSIYILYVCIYPHTHIYLLLCYLENKRIN